MNFDYNTFLTKTPERQLDILEWTCGMATTFGIPKENILIKIIGNEKFPSNLVKRIFQEKKWGCTPNMTGAVNTSAENLIRIPLCCYSAICGQYDRTKLIIDQGADVTKTFHYHQIKSDITPLEYLISQSYLDPQHILQFVELFVNAGANTNQLVSFTTNNDNILTFLATIIKEEYELVDKTSQAIFNLIKLLKFLIINGADSSHQNNSHQSYYEIIPYEVRSNFKLKKISQIKYIKSQKCVVCKDALPTVSVLPCGHICFCIKCTLNDSNSFVSCPLCRRYICQYQSIDYHKNEDLVQYQVAPDEERSVDIYD